MKNIFVTALFIAFTCVAAAAQTVYSSTKGEKYHTADCKLSGEASPIKLADAKKNGKNACGVCKPDEWVKAKLNLCEGKTKDGTRCKRMTANKNKKCYQHQSK
ncbi:hypothetical protein [Pseudochryseolinea flava]|nr:hypothetical protein [Pseudochryseolinea flava]